MTNANKCAFPWVEGSAEGLSKREWLVGMALSGLCASSKQVERVPTAEARERIANAAVQMADETLAKLERTK